MENILLVCSAGITSAMLVRKMQDAAEANRLNYNITSANAVEVKLNINDVDVVLLSPQVKHLKESIEQLITSDTKVIVLSPEMYAAMDGYAVIQLAKDALQ